VISEIKLPVLRRASSSSREGAAGGRAAPAEDGIDLDDLMGQLLEEGMDGPDVGDGLGPGCDGDDAMDDGGPGGADGFGGDDDAGSAAGEGGADIVLVRPPTMMGAPAEKRAAIYGNVAELVSKRKTDIEEALELARLTIIEVAENGDMSLVIKSGGSSSSDGPADDPHVAFVHWTDIDFRQGRRVTVMRDGTIKAIIAYRVPVESFSDAVVVINVCPGRMMHRRKKDGADTLPHWCLLRRDKYRHQSFSGPLAEYNPLMECVQCTCCRLLHVETEPLVTDIYVCQACLSYWHNSCADFFHGAKQNTIEQLGVLLADWICPVCHSSVS
jgi:diadenosine tetraphosphatase ApaH/serine/threonine PP2A family protein phosphatase